MHELQHMTHQMTMLEQIARAICKATGDNWDREGPAGLMDAYGPMARAVVQAMLKPSEAMLSAGRKANMLVKDNRLGMSYVAPNPAYQAMLGVILNETPETQNNPTRR